MKYLIPAGTICWPLAIYNDNGSQAFTEHRQMPTDREVTFDDYDISEENDFPRQTLIFQLPKAIGILPPNYVVRVTVDRVMFRKEDVTMLFDETP